MKRWWLVSVAAAVVCVPAYGVGGAGSAPGLGLAELATALGLEAPGPGPQQGTVGQAQGGGVGLLEQIRTSLEGQEIPGTGVGMPARFGAWMAADHAEETAGAATHAQLQQHLSGSSEPETTDPGTNEAEPNTETGESSEQPTTAPSPLAAGGMAYALAERMAVQKATQAAGAGAHAQLQEGLANQVGLGPAAEVQEMFRQHLMRRAGVQ